MANKRQLDECLSIRERHLFIEDCDAVELAREFGTPLFVMSEDQLRRNIRRFIRAFSERWPEGSVDILPAIKANWNLTLRRILTEEGAGCDIFSPNELYAALESGVNPAIVSVNGGGKSPEHIENCLKAGVRITIDDIDELDLINQTAVQLGLTARVRFRLRPDMPSQWRPTDFSVEMVPVDLGFQAYKGGIPTEHLIEIGRRARKMKNIEIMGYHIHLGRHHESLSLWREGVRAYVKLISDLKTAWGGYLPREIDIGGGIPVPRDPFRKIINRLDGPLLSAFWALMPVMRLLGDDLRYRLISRGVQMFSKSPNRKLVPSVEAYAETITSEFRKQFTEHGIPVGGMHLQIEPGRSIYGNAGVHLSSVLKTKSQTRPISWNWVLLDTTYFFMTGGVFEYNLHDYVVANHADRPPEILADVVGRSCYADRILPEVRFPLVAAGDLVAFLDMGAYQEVSACNFNALPRPGTVLVKGDQAEWIRLPESNKDVFRRDVIPDRFKPKKTNPRPRRRQPAAPVRSLRRGTRR